MSPSPNNRTVPSNKRGKSLAVEIAAEARLLYHITLAKNRGTDHAGRMEAYFGPQADAYDRFRERLLQGRRELYHRLPTPEGGVWLEMAGGTGHCLEFLGDRLHRLKRVHIVDVSPSLLAKAQERIERHGWTNVECHLLDAAVDPLPVDRADVATFSYSLSMIPDWFAAIDRVRGALAPGGTIGVCDFHLARKYPQPGHPHHSALGRVFWQLFFGGDDVFPNVDHLPYLQQRFRTLDVAFGRGRIPYLPLWAPWYRFIGRVGNSRGDR